jgi:hypothetical protein
LGEIETYKIANGYFVKFINHRTKLVEGSLQYFCDFVTANIKEKPEVYFANGVLDIGKKSIECNSFDLFVRELSYWSSWSTGMAFWKSDFNKIKNLDNCNELFPHTDILFANKTKNRYIVDNTFLLEEIKEKGIPKGRYNLFYAFAVEYPSIILDLYRKRNITLETFLQVKEENLKFIANLYLSYILLKRQCSYDLSNYRNSINVMYDISEVRKTASIIFLTKVKKRFFKLKETK